MDPKEILDAANIYLRGPQIHHELVVAKPHSVTVESVEPEELPGH